jgi:geranylgeranyl reductase family protein
MAHFDLLIVGAGPGGSNAAAVALRAGLRVAQVDAARFPRIKPCAGGMTIKAARALRLALAPSLRRSFKAVEFNIWEGRGARFAHPDHLLHMVCRPELDNDLVQQNLAHDAFTFIDGCRVREITFEDRRLGGFRAITDRGTLTSAQVIGADGAHSLVNRIFRISESRLLATAVEVNLPRSDHDRDCDRTPCFDFGAIDRGYGWVFPKDDHDSVGLYTLAPRTADIRARLVAYIRAKGFRPAGDPLAGFQAFRIPVGGYRLHTPRCPVYIVGDAGGFADALTGEGIYYALESGRLAGEVAVDVAHGRRTHRSFYRRLWRTVLCDTAATLAAARACYRHIDRGIGLLQHPLVSRSLIEGCASADTFTGSLLKAGWYLPRAWIRDGGSASRLPRPLTKR